MIKPTHDELLFVPLGGTNEIGMNLNLYGHNGKWLMVDFGITFHNKLGLEILSPNLSFLENIKEDIVGMVATHAHEDHIGAIPYLWPYVRCPIYASPFTEEVIRRKLEEKSWRKKVELKTVPLEGEVALGDFNIKFISLTHSIPEPNALLITTKAGKIFHTGDWKIDPDPVVGEAIDSKVMKALGKEKIDALVCDSTNVFSQGSSGSEGEVKKEVEKLVASFPDKRISVACFASNIARVKTIVSAAAEAGRKVALLGFSLNRMVEVAQKVGYLKDISAFIPIDQVADMPPEKVLLITTGSQGEERAALSRISRQSHPSVSFGKDDIVFFSSRIIPGNEKGIFAMQNRLAQLGVKIITSEDENIHVSGHPYRNELEQMYTWIKPKILIPVHGEPRHIIEHTAFGLSCGIPKAVTPHNGCVINVGKAEIIDVVPSGCWGLDGNRFVNMESGGLKERDKLSREGVLVAHCVVKKKKLVAAPSVSLFGLCEHGGEAKVLSQQVEKKIATAISRHWTSEKDLEKSIQHLLKTYILRELGKRPIVDVHIKAI